MIQLKTNQSSKPARRSGIRRDPASKRRAIIESALKIFAAQGFHGTNTADIAKLADVAVGSIFRLFSTKEELANQVYLHCDALYQAHLPQDFLAESSPQAQFGKLWDAMVSFYRQSPDAFIFFEINSHRAYMDETAKLARQRHKTRLFEVIRYWQKIGALRDEPHEILRALVIGSLSRLVREADESGFPITDKLITQLKDLCWTAIKHPAK